MSWSGPRIACPDEQAYFRIPETPEESLAASRNAGTEPMIKYKNPAPRVDFGTEMVAHKLDLGGAGEFWGNCAAIPDSFH